MENQEQIIDPSLQLLREREVAKLLDVSIYKIQRMRVQGNGPAYLKISASVRYRLSDIRDYLNQNVVRSTSDCKDIKEK